MGTALANSWAGWKLARGAVGMAEAVKWRTKNEPRLKQPIVTVGDKHPA